MGIRETSSASRWTMLLLGASIVGPGSGHAQCPTAEFVPPSVGAAAHFGNWVAIDGDFMAVAAELYDQGGTDKGAVFMYRRVNGNWTSIGPLPADAVLGAGDRFGASVAISGTRVIVGAPGSDVGAPNGGAAYIFDWVPATQSWTVPIRLLAGSPEPPEPDQEFGTAVDIDGDYAVVGAPLDNAGATFGFDLGAAWAYKRNTNGTWSSGQFLWPAFSQEEFDQFGYRVAISGKVIAVAANLHDGDGLNSGIVQIYRRDFSSSWEPSEVISQPEAQTGGDQFGIGLDLDGDTLVVGVPLDDELGTNAGAVFLFKQHPQFPSYGFDFVKKLKPTVPQVNGQLGRTVALDGDVLAAGQFAHDSPNATDGGAVQVFRHLGTSWNPEPLLVLPQVAAGDFFGYGLSVSDPRIAIGSPLRDSTSADMGRVDVVDYTACTAVYGMPTTIPIMGGGVHQLQINAGPANASRSYFLLGTTSGTAPGIGIGAAHLPLNVDAFTFLLLASAGPAGFSGVLDAEGRAMATLPIPGCLPFSALGINLDHAALVYSPGYSVPNVAVGPWRTAFRAPDLAIPQAVISVIYLDGDDELDYGVAPKILFDGYDSYTYGEVPNEIEAYYWTFSDGGTATGVLVDHEYPKGGTYTCGLTVVDSFGACHFASQTVVINQMPLAAFSYPETVISGVDAEFDAEDSTDPEGKIAWYEWQFGSHSLPKTSDKSVTYNFQQLPGTKVKVRLVVIDDDGLAGSNAAEHEITLH